MKVLRFLFRFALALILAILIVISGLYISGNSHLIKAVRSTYLVGKKGPTIDDHTKFTNRIIRSNNSEKWVKSKSYNTLELSAEQEVVLESWESTSLLIIKDNKLVFEKYWEGYNKESKTNSFSVAKSLVSIAIGAAIKEGKIKSVKQKVADFIPEFETEDKKDISIEDLLQMNSGIDFGESYGDPFGFMAKAYYGKSLYNLTVKKEVSNKAGSLWKYQGGNSLLLSFILKKATGLSLSEYFESKIWNLIGATSDALWTISEEDSLERSYCCFYSNPRDFAKIGQLMLDSGSWNGEEVISKKYFINSIAPVNSKDENGNIIDYYGYQWWLGEDEGEKFYYARGILGQYIVVLPNLNAVFVRLGHKRDPTRNVEVPSDLYQYLDIVKGHLSKI